MSCGIYLIQFSPDCLYVGSSAQIENRIGEHKRSFIRGSHYNYRMKDAFDKYGEFESTVLLVCRKEDLIFYEQLCIDRFAPTLNISAIAGRPDMNQETRAKLRAARLGKPLSDEHKKKLSDSHMGFRPSLASRAWQSAARIGNKHTLGHKLSEDHKSKVSVGLKRYYAKRNEPRVVPDDVRAKISKTLREYNNRRKKATEARKKDAGFGLLV